MFIDLLRKRRSCRRFENRPIEEAKVRILMEAALRSPSSRSLCPWRFLVVRDRNRLEKLAGAKPHGAAFLGQAAMAIVIYANPDKCDVWVEDASIATLLLHLTATSLDLGSCWVQIRKRHYNDQMTAGQYVADLLNIPDSFEVEAIMAIGYPAEIKKPHDAMTLLMDRISYERHGGPAV